MANILIAELDTTLYSPKAADEISTAKEVWALCVEVSGYSGRLVRVVRTSDSVEQDIYADSDGRLDIASLLTFAGSNTCEVMTIAGQKGFSDATATAGKRPKIVDSGTLVTENGEPAMLFDGVDDYFSATLPYSAATSPLSISVVETQHTATGVSFCVGSSSLSAGLNIYFYNIFNYLIGSTYRTSGANSAISTSGVGANVTNLVTTVADRTNLKNYINGSLDVTTVDNNSNYNIGTNVIIGSQSGSGNFFNGTMQFIGVWHSDEGNNQSELYAELNKRYNIVGNPTIQQYHSYKYFGSQTYVTKNTDTLPNVVFNGDISNNFSLEKELGFFVWGTQSKTTVGSIVLINNKGDYDDLYDIGIRDSIIKLSIVDEYASHDTAIQIGEFLVDQISNANDNYIKLDLVDKISLLDKNTKHQYFSNTIQFINNRELPMPIPVGFIYQAPLSIVDSTTNQYHLMPEYSAGDDTNVEATIVTKDRADPFVLNVDYTVIQLASTNGMGVDLSSPNDGTITADYIGYRYNGNDTNDFENFVGKLLVDSGGFLATDIDFTSAAAIDTDLGYNYGIYIKSGTNIKAILDRVVASHCGFYYQNKAGKIVFDYLQAPDVTASFEIDSINLASGVKVELDLAQGLTDSVAARKNVHVFSYDEVRDIGGLSEEDKQKASSEYRIYARSAITIAGNDTFHDTYAHAREGCYFPSLLVNESDANGLITQQEGLYGVERKFYGVDYDADNIFSMLEIELNTTYKLTHNRYGLDSGKNLRVTKITIPNILKNRIAIRGWG